MKCKTKREKNYPTTFLFYYQYSFFLTPTENYVGRYKAAIFLNLLYLIFFYLPFIIFCYFIHFTFASYHCFCNFTFIFLLLNFYVLLILKGNGIHFRLAFGQYCGNRWIFQYNICLAHCLKCGKMQGCLIIFFYTKFSQVYTKIPKPHRKKTIVVLDLQKSLFNKYYLLMLPIPIQYTSHLILVVSR